MRAALLLCLLAAPALAQDPGPALTGDAFEAIVEGRTFDTHDETGLYGVETFLPGRRAIWRDVTQCLEGIWRVEGDLICFDYDGDPQPHCWTYHSRGDGLIAWYQGDRTQAPISLFPSPEVVTCEGYFGV
jgi:hypothetical protein